MIFERTASEALGTLEWAIGRHRQREATLEEELGQMGRESHVLRQSYDKLQKTLGGLETERDGYKETNFRVNCNGMNYVKQG